MEQKIIIQEKEIVLAEAYDFLQGGATGGLIGATVVFTGTMRSHHDAGDTSQAIEKMVIEHYDEMTHASIAAMVATAAKKFSCQRIMVNHRVGVVQPRDIIVVVGVSAVHRGDAFHAAEMLMDYLKTTAPFWKKEIMANGAGQWVSARATDQTAKEKWG